MAQIYVSAGISMLEGLTRTPQVGVCELVWNAFDEDAKHVTIEVETNDFGVVDLIRVSDDGRGMNRARAEKAFATVGDSWKLMPGTKTADGRPVHGKHGRGRFAAFSLGRSVHWVSTSKPVDSEELASIEIRGDRSNLGVFEIDDITAESETPETRVVITTLTEEAQRAFEDVASIRQRLLTEFALHLERHTDFHIELLGATIEPSAVILGRSTHELDLPEDVEGQATLTVIEWDLDDVERRLYLCRRDGTIVGELQAGIKAAGAEFTAYVSWDGFVHDQQLLMEDDTESAPGKVVAAARAALKAHLATSARRREADTVKRWKKEGVYPYKNDPATPAEKATRDTFNFVAMAAARTVDESKSQTSKALALSLFKETFENDPEALLPILRKFSKLSRERIDELSEILEHTSLAHLISLGKEVGDRIEFINGLNSLLFDRQTKKRLLERRQLHRILAQETWIFGEEWSLTGDDDRLTEVLKKYLKMLGEDVALADTKPVLREDGSVAIPDLVLGRQLPTRENHFSHLVVELKRPSHKLTDEDVTQLRSYANAVTKDERFDQPNSSWEFWLIGNDALDTVNDARNQQHLPSGVVQQSLKYTLVVRTWAEILGDAVHRLKFVQQSLQYASDRDSGLASMRDRYAEYLPEETLKVVSDASDQLASSPHDDESDQASA